MTDGYECDAMTLPQTLRPVQADASPERLEAVRRNEKAWVDITNITYFLWPETADKRGSANVVRATFQEYMDLGIGLTFQEVRNFDCGRYAKQCTCLSDVRRCRLRGTTSTQSPFVHKCRCVQGATCMLYGRIRGICVHTLMLLVHSGALCAFVHCLTFEPSVSVHMPATCGIQTVLRKLVRVWRMRASMCSDACMQARACAPPCVLQCMLKLATRHHQRYHTD